MQEWADDLQETDPQHRHVSHVYGVYPGKQLTPDKTPELLAAVRKTLDIRGDASTGWSLAWKINLWVRLRDGDHAHRLIDLLFTQAEITSHGGNPCIVRVDLPLQVWQVGTQIEMRVTENDLIEFKTHRGRKYTLKPSIA